MCSGIGGQVTASEYFLYLLKNLICDEIGL